LASGDEIGDQTYFPLLKTRSVQLMNGENKSFLLYISHAKQAGGFSRERATKISWIGRGGLTRYGAFSPCSGIS